MRDAALKCSVGLLLAACPEQKPPQPSPVDTAVAIVDGQSISRQEFERELAQEAGVSEVGKRSVLESMIERVVLLRARLIVTGSDLSLTGRHVPSGS